MTADSRYDAVVVGGGHHGTIIACYLAKAGLSVGVFERNSNLGGAAASEAGPAPGFRMNCCAHWTRFYGHPAYRDFGLHAERLRYVFPDENQSMVFEDGSSLLGYAAFKVVEHATGRSVYAQENVDRTYRQIRQFSQRDADTYLQLLEKYSQYWKAALDKHRFTPPSAWDVEDPLEELLGNPDSGIEPVHQYMTMRQLAYDFFESAELRTLFMRAAAIATGCFADDVIGLQGLIHALPSTLSFEPAAVAIGATQSVTDALVSAGRRMGVEHFTNAEVDEILASRSHAVGVRLKGGAQIRAEIVVSALGVSQTILRLMRNLNVSDRILRRVRNIHYDRGQLFSVNVALHEPPEYSAALFNPGIGPQSRLLWGAKDPDYLASRYQAEIFLKGYADRLYAFSSVDTAWDPSRAPDGKHLATINELAAPRRLFTREQWREIKEAYKDQLLRQWRHYAPNMTRDNVIAISVVAPDDIEAKLPDMLEGGYCEGTAIASQLGCFRPIPELAQYRAVLSNVYICSSSAHSGSGIGRGSSYNCFYAIAADLGLTFDSAESRPAVPATDLGTAHRGAVADQAPW